MESRRSQAKPDVTLLMTDAELARAEGFLTMLKHAAQDYVDVFEKGGSKEDLIRALVNLIASSEVVRKEVETTGKEVPALR